MHPDVVTCAVAQEPGAVAPEPALELSALHSGGVGAAGDRREQPVAQSAERLDDPRLHRERDPLGEGRLVSEVVQRLEHVDPGIMPGGALRDRFRNLDDLSREPPVLVLGVADRQLSRLS